MSKHSWSEAPSAKRLPDGRRLHLQQGPIDLIVEACGREAEIARAYDQACAAFGSILSDLSAELPRLRRAHGPLARGTIARTMCLTVAPFAPTFVTPMAAVAGSVADHVLACLLKGRSLTRAYVNNGGDIALHLQEGIFRVGICTDPVTGKAGGVIDLSPEAGVGGIATSGWRGRSHSLGIADAVTVLATTAAQADAAATLIANAVDLPGSPRVSRVAATDLAPDSDLGERLVTTEVAALSASEIRAALHAGEALARHYQSRGLILGASIALAGDHAMITHQQQQQKQIDISREAACA